MKLVISNYGAIKRSTIDLSKKLYVFVGYNNTGKTYLTKLIYEIFNPDTLTEFSNSNYNKFDYEGTDNLTLTQEIIDEVLLDFSKFLKNVIIKKILKTKSHRNLSIKFEYDIKDVKKDELKSGAIIGVPETKTEVEIYNLKKKKNSLEINFEHFNLDDIFSKLPSDFFDIVPKKSFKDQIISVKQDVSKRIIASLLNLLLQIKEKPFFLPSNRVSILENAEEFKRQDDLRKKELSEFIIDLLENKTKKKTSISKMLAKKSESEQPSYIEYLINKIVELRSEKDDDFIIKGTGFYNKLLLNFKNILGGEIVFEKKSKLSNRVEKFKIEENKAIVMQLASSSVNQLSSLFLFLKYWAKPERNFLMIDEPEENLHPKNQILLLNLLMEFIDTNNRLLITTHSPLITETINNYIILSQLKDSKKIAKDRGLNTTSINPNNTGIYFFQGEKTVEHTSENYGTTFTSFKLAQDDVYNLGEELRDLMFTQLNKD